MARRRRSIAIRGLLKDLPRRRSQRMDYNSPGKPDYFDTITFIKAHRGLEERRYSE